MNHFLHDFKGGLSTVIMCIDGLRDGIGGPVPPRMLPWLERAERKCEHMVELISDFRDMTLLEEGRLSPDPETLELSACAEAVRSVIENSAMERRVNVRFKAPSHLPRARYQYRLAQRILDRVHSVLLDCARTGGALESEWNIARQGPDRILRVDIRAEGIEVADDLLESVFDKVAQADLGLQIGRGYTMRFCRLAARELGGDLALLAWPGNGNAAALWLPLA
jgi:K+-sensing histidine kinase KdpD